MSCPCADAVRPYECLISGRVATELELSNAVHDIQFTNDNCHNITDELLRTPFLEIAIAGARDIEPFRSWLLESLAYDPVEMRPQSSIALAALMRISQAFLSPTIPVEREESTRLMQYYSYLKAMPEVLRAIANMQLPEYQEQFDHAGFDPLTVQDDDDELEDILSRFKTRKKQKRPKKQHWRKKSECLQRTDTQLFKEMGLEPPATKKEGQDLVNMIMSDVQIISLFCLNILRRDAIFESLKASMLSLVVPTSPEARTEIMPSESTSAVANMTTAFPAVQPMKAALYFDTANGFGDWRIQISSRAEKHLREAKRNDAKLFKIIVKKIKELSNGHFSDDNQKRLNGSSNGVPIFEAKMTRDTRLVYQVDCIPDYSSDVEMQVIKIYGIYSHAKLDGRLWDSMGYQLAGKGREYIRRCTFRNRPALQNDKVFSPAVFPAPVESEASDVVRQPQLPEQDLDEIHSLLVLEKFVSFSQALLNSIIMDWDVVFPFDLTPQERKIIDHTASCYVLGRSGTGKTTTMLFKMLGIERAFEMQGDGLQKPRQIFVTQSRVLVQKVEEYFHKLLHSLVAASQSTEKLKSLLQAKSTEDKGGDLVDDDEEYAHSNDLPKKFSLLKDENFPLFLTFDALCTLLEGDVNSIELDGTVDGDNRGSLITYHKFWSSYWPHFPQSLTKGLDSSMVYSEIMGVIKGSEDALRTDCGYVDQHTYEALSHRTQSTFARQRKTIYEIFSTYTKQKRMRHEFDPADRTHTLLQNMQSKGLGCRPIDFLYVDEVQDNLLADTLLMRSICHNADGLFWAGDTAQTISVGSSFRFNELKSFLHRLEQQRVSVKASQSPQTFQLAINYRSHAGIVNAAHSVIGLITQFWPYSIDVLDRETGVVDGLRPVFFHGFENDGVRYEQFLFGNSGSHIEFGAHQAILVRDEDARNKLREQVGDIGVILTLYESKGLEFNDVLLYNFFEHSKMDLTCWRVVLNAIEGDGARDLRVPAFDATRHAGLCSELKFLYVAITRARKNMWIVDRSEKAEPMRLFWSSMNQIQNCTPSTDVPHLAVSSTPQEWANQGRTLFKHKQYLQAMHCFQRAELPRHKRISNAYYLREQARKMIETDSVQIRRHGTEKEAAFINAAHAFIESAQETRGKDSLSYYRIAAECFEKGDKPREAADTYVHAAEYDHAATLYRKLGMFDEAVDVIRNHRDLMQIQLVERIIDVARLFYFGQQQLEKANQLFSSLDEELEYLEDLELDVARATLLESLGRISEAAELHFAEGRTLEACQLVLKDSFNQQSVKQGVNYILQSLWQNPPFDFEPSTKNITAGNLVGLLELTRGLDLSMLDLDTRNEIEMFAVIAELPKAQSTLRSLGKTFHDSSNIAASLLCLDHYFSEAKFPVLQTMSCNELLDELNVFYIYVKLLHDIALDPSLCQNEVLKKLFRFTYASQNLIMISEGTFLFDQERIQGCRTMRHTEGGAHVEDWEFSREVRHILHGRLKSRVTLGNEACNRVRALSPCLAFADSYCNRNLCPQEHISSIDQNYYNGRVRVHLQQIMISQTLHCIEENQVDVVKRRRLYIGRLYDALFPPSLALGCFGELRPNDIPEYDLCLPVVRDWCRDFIYILNPFQSSTFFLTTLSRALRLSTLFCQDNDVITYFTRAASCNLDRLPAWCIRPDTNSSPGSSIIKELSSAILGSNETSLVAGFLTIRHIVQSRIPIDINVLCELIEYLIGLLVLCKRYSKETLLHQATLPRGLLSTILSRLQNFQFHWRFPFQIILAPLQMLLERLYLKDAYSEWLLFERTDVSKVGSTVTSVFVARICKSLALLGYNHNNPILRNDIVRVLNSLKKGYADRTFHRSYREYIQARTWPDVVRCVRQMHKDMHSDELIHLYYAPKATGVLPRSPGIRTLVFTSLDGILTSLQAPVKARLDAEAAPFVPKSLLTSASEAEENPTEATTEDLTRDQDQDLEDTIDKDDGDNGAESEETPVDLSQPEFESTPPTEEETRAATFIQLRYKAKQAARKHVPRGYESHFTRCLVEAQQAEWNPRSFYRKLFLGPLPHVLCSIYGAIARIQEQKDMAKKRFKNALGSNHSELESCSAKLTQTNTTLKRAHDLCKALEPTAAMHRNRSKEELKKLVLQVQDLIQNFVGADMYAVKDDLGLGVKAIVTEPKVIKKEKPSLVVEDDLLY